MRKLRALFAYRMAVTLKIWIASAVFFLAILACNLPAAPYDVYVATNGNDSNDCRSAAHACLTIPAAIGKAVTASVVHVGAGTFAGGFMVNKFVTIQGAGQTSTIINQPNNSSLNVDIGDSAAASPGGAITATLSDMTLSGGWLGVGLFNHGCHLIGNNLIITGFRSSGVDNTQAGRVELTNSIISNGSVGIENAGVFNGNHLIIQGSVSTGVHNTGAMTLQNTTVQHITGGAAVDNEAVGGRMANLIFNKGVITNNSGSGLINRAASSATITSTTISHNQQLGIDNYGTMELDNVETENNTMMGLSSEIGSKIDVSQSAFVNNLTGIALNQATAHFTNSTVSNNSGDGINVTGTSLDLSFATVAFNSRGLVFGTSSVQMHNSIVELNHVSNCVAFGVGLAVDSGNLACNDALTNATLNLGILTLATGTKVIPLETGSTAINHATGACPPVDQRNYTRPHGTACDTGSYEFGAVMALEFGTPGTQVVTDTPGALVILPTDTPTLSVLEIATDTPVATGTPTVQVPSQVLLNKNSNCRKGPGTNYEVVTSYLLGQAVAPAGRNDAGTWLIVQMANDPQCWIAASNLTPTGPWNYLTVLPNPPLPDAPANFTDKSVCVPKPPSLVVTLNWSDMSNVSGYHIYMNGQLLVTLKAGVTKYSFKAPTGKGLLFQLEAFNANGVSDQVSTTVSSCP